MVKLLLGLAARPVAARRRRRAGRRDLPPALASAGAGRRRPAPRRTREARDELASLPARTPVIAHLRGRILEKHRTAIVVDVNGVGYDVAVPLSTFYGLASAGAEIALRIHTHVREDALALYGFATRAGAGSVRAADWRSAASGRRSRSRCCPGSSRADLMRAIERGDVARLTAIPGRRQENRPSGSSLELKDRLPRAHSRRPRALHAAPTGVGARRCPLGAAEPGLSSAARRKSCRCRASRPRPTATSNAR